MSRVLDLLTRVSEDLNDFAENYEYTTWPKEQLRAYMLEAFQLVLKSRPEIFNEDRVLALRSGSEHHDIRGRCGCDSLSLDGVLGQSDKYGNILRRVRPRSDGALDAFPGGYCPTRPYRILEYAVSADGKSVRVYPSVPPRETVYLAVRCAVIPRRDRDGVPEEIAPAVVQWMLYRAKMVDGENNPAVLSAAVYHWQTCAALLGVKIPRSGRSSGGGSASSSASSGGAGGGSAG
jgi:hypothetical protein